MFVPCVCKFPTAFEEQSLLQLRMPCDLVLAEFLVLLMQRAVRQAVGLPAPPGAPGTAALNGPAPREGPGSGNTGPVVFIEGSAYATAGFPVVAAQNKPAPREGSDSGSSGSVASKEGGSASGPVGAAAQNGLAPRQSPATGDLGGAAPIRGGASITPGVSPAAPTSTSPVTTPAPAGAALPPAPGGSGTQRLLSNRLGGCSVPILVLLAVLIRVWSPPNTVLFFGSSCEVEDAAKVYSSVHRLLEVLIPAGFPPAAALHAATAAAIAPHLHAPATGAGCKQTSASLFRQVMFIISVPLHRL